jgi:hypothetical protein
MAEDVTVEGDTLDLIWGAQAIAEALNLKSRRQAFVLLEQGALPARKVGKSWVVSRAALKRHFEAAA